MLKKIIISLLICLSLSSINVFACTTTLDVTNSYNITSPVTYDCVYVQNGGTLKADYPLNVTKEMIIYSGGIVTHTGSQTSDTYRVNITAVNLTINSGGSIDVVGKGYKSNNGPGTSSSVGCAGSGGAGHGGDGGDASSSDGSYYDDLTNPTQLGSGAGSNWYVSGGSGGGTILLDISDTLTINGNISANGNPGVSFGPDSGGGSGGTINIVASSALGSSSITANGGSITNAGGGSGGRIALAYDTLSSSITITAYGGTSNVKPGAAGTIFKKSSSQTYGDLIIDNNNLDNLDINQYNHVTSFSSDENFDNIYLNHYGVFRVNTGQNISSDNVYINNTGVLKLLSSADFDYNSLFWTNSGRIADYGATVPLLASDVDLEVPATTQLDLNSPVTLGNVIINGLLSHQGSQTSDTYRVNITAVNLTVNSSGSIDVDGKGYKSNNGPGKSNSVGVTSSGGAGHGGLGGNAGGSGGTYYDDLTNPTQLGSGAGPNSFVQGGSGGGTILLDISDTLTINGNISANGNPGVSFGPDSGGGSGGTINIVASSALGSSSITANGGSITNAGGGSGGRIALAYDTLSSSITITAYGGTSNVKPGAAGTIFKKSSSQTYGDLIIDNNNLDNLDINQYNHVTSFSSDENFDNIYLNHYGVFRVNTGQNISSDNVYINNTGVLKLLSSADFDYNSLFWTNSGRIADYGATVPLLASDVDLEVPATTQLDLNSPVTLGNVIINGLLSHQGSQTSDTYRVNITAVNLTVNSSGSIDVDGKGYKSNNGPGKSNSVGVTSSGGAGHGGLGGNAGGSGGTYYDDLTNPTQLGSGAGPNSFVQGGSGGGTILLDISDTLTINGNISANGNPGVSFGPDSGGGSGGTINIVASSALGSSSITANGGSITNAGGGSGGRIAIYTQENTYTGSTSTNGGTGGNDGGAGTIFTCTSIDGVTNCHNSSTGINLDVSYNTTKSMTVKRTVNTLWSNNLVQWQDIGSDVTNNYTISGLKSNTLYNIYENSTLSTSLTTNSEGILPTFTISLYGTHDLLVSEDSTIPETEEESVNFFPFGSLISIFSSLSAIFLYSVFRKQSY